MPKNVFVPKPAVEKLPLAVRKDLRDDYESQKADFESTISGLLGTTFHININANEVYAYIAEGWNSSLGGTFNGYIEAFIDALKSYVEQFGDEGKIHFNEAVTQSELTLHVNELGDNAGYMSADVKDGVFRILFKDQALGYNQSDIIGYLLKAVEAVPRAGFSLETKHSIEEDYNSEIEELQKEIGDILAMPDVILDPNFEENYAALAVKTNEWHSDFGKVLFQYFTGLKDQLVYQNFKDDDMLQEGFADTVTSKTFKIRVVEKTKSTIDTVLEDGTVYIQMTPDYWWYNASDAGSGLVDLL